MPNNDNRNKPQGGNDMDRQRQNQGQGQPGQNPNMPKIERDKEKMGQQAGEKRDLPKGGVTDEEDTEQRELDDEERITQRQPQQKPGGEKPPIKK